MSAEEGNGLGSSERRAAQLGRPEETASQKGNFATLILSVTDVIQQGNRSGGRLTASGCFHGQDKLLSMAPNDIEGTCSSLALDGVPDRLSMASYLRYGLDVLDSGLGLTDTGRGPGSAARVGPLGFGGSATIETCSFFQSILIIQLSNPRSVLRIM